VQTTWPYHREVDLVHSLRVADIRTPQAVQPPVPLFQIFQIMIDNVIEHMYDVNMSSARTIELETALNEATGRLNLAHAELVAVIVQVLETGCWNGHGIRSPEHWVTWKTGASPARARDLVLVAKRSVELPVTTEAFGEGLLSVDQVDFA
jgi:Domain of unknown function (DUF222)